MRCVASRSIGEASFRQINSINAHPSPPRSSQPRFLALATATGLAAEAGQVAVIRAARAAMTAARVATTAARAATTAARAETTVARAATTVARAATTVAKAATTVAKAAT